MVRSAVLALVLASSLAAGCTTPHGLDREPLASSAEETAAVAAQVEKARAAGEWTLAWNQSVDMGASREALEDVAVQALEADARGADEMFAALLLKWGSLTPASRARVSEASRRAREAKDPVRAAEIEIAAAEDAPQYRAAWRIYAAAEAEDAHEVLEEIREARRKHARRPA
jgi:hypothetical protein